MSWDYKKTVVYHWWRVILQDVLRTDRIWYIIICSVLFFNSIGLCKFTHYMAFTPIIEHKIVTIHYEGTKEKFRSSRREEENVWENIALVTAFALVIIIEFAFVIAFFTYLHEMLRNFLNPEYDALRDFKSRFK